MSDKERYEKIAEDFLMKMTSQQERRFIEIVDNNKHVDYYRLLANEFELPHRAIRVIFNKFRAEGKLRDKIHNKWNDSEICYIKQMIDAGHSTAEIAIELKRHESSIRKKVKELYGCIPVMDNLDGEEWHVIYNDYEISNYGRLRRTGQRKFLKGSVKEGYVRISIRTKDGDQSKFVHRLVAEAFIPNPQNKEIVDHIDGNRANNHVSNLRWVTAEENSNNIHRLKLLSEQAEKRKTDKLINDSLKAIFDTGLSKLDLIQKILDYKEVSHKD